MGEVGGQRHRAWSRSGEVAGGEDVRRPLAGLHGQQDRGHLLPRAVPQCRQPPAPFGRLARGIRGVGAERFAGRGRRGSTRPPTELAAGPAIGSGGAGARRGALVAGQESRSALPRRRERERERQQRQQPRERIPTGSGPRPHGRSVGDGAASDPFHDPRVPARLFPRGRLRPLLVGGHPPRHGRRLTRLAARPRGGHPWRGHTASLRRGLRRCLHLGRHGLT
mmetsp:Transcript_88611/g.246610  ORF Transcript_88611/g.246610 Transcript_88611/m.246610 type:complete len:223 (+) Transcript_88611:157-825(+)